MALKGPAMAYWKQILDNKIEHNTANHKHTAVDALANGVYT